eukprot:CAMPEP_0115742422 /NCGR_PEP_ID=MMETSP0272-20121206/90521_1 /TAXON_ID=71861 /ORGANISM="Scrippsiella trochoidea, Strain CCMP3099" /LENGTH=47 /DNA_ID= /DNA_START= /DNA_END= /DNA_ORIENTATION=
MAATDPEDAERRECDDGTIDEVGKESWGAEPTMRATAQVKRHARQDF